MNEKELMMTSLLDCRRLDLLMKQPTLTEKQQLQYEKMKKRRNSGEPLQYIIGEVDFMGLSLKVDPRVLIPRPETEILVDLVVEKIKEKYFDRDEINILDLGTGSGSIAIALAKMVSNIQVTSVDVSQDALNVARENALNNCVEQKIKFVCMDMLKFLDQSLQEKSSYDVIISNPPYIKTSQLNNLPEDVKREPVLALDGGVDGLYFYRGMEKYVHLLLKPQGFLALEIGDGQREEIELIFSDDLYGCVDFYKDYVGTDRVVMIYKKDQR